MAFVAGLDGSSARPSTIALTGGDRRIPVLQVGADVYCDTALIAEYLGDRGSSPILFPATRQPPRRRRPSRAGSIPNCSGPAATLRFMPENMGILCRSGCRTGICRRPCQLRARLRMCAAPRSMKRRPATPGSSPKWIANSAMAAPDLFGADWSVADFAVYHMLWFIHAGGGMSDLLASRPHAAAWMARMRASRAASGRGHFRRRSHRSSV